MQITINGDKREISNGTTARQLLGMLNLKGPLALEINRIICPKNRHDQTLLKNGDVLEIVTIVGGG